MNIAENIDCLKAMKNLPDKAFDLAVVDPPYFSGPERRGYYGRKVSKIGVHRDYPISPKWDIPTREYFDELERVAKRYIVWGCNYFDYHFAPGRIVWDKCNEGSPFSDCEIAATNCHDSVRLFRYMWNGMMQGKSIAEGFIQQGNKALNEQRIHPTQKPVARFTCGCCRSTPSPETRYSIHTSAAEAAVSPRWSLGSTLWGMKSTSTTSRCRKSALMNIPRRGAFLQEVRDE